MYACMCIYTERLPSEIVLVLSTALPLSVFPSDYFPSIPPNSQLWLPSSPPSHHGLCTSSSQPAFYSTHGSRRPSRGTASRPRWPRTRNRCPSSHTGSRTWTTRRSWRGALRALRGGGGKLRVSLQPFTYKLLGSGWFCFFEVVLVVSWYCERGKDG
jgi:hypothetical protein